MIGNGPVVLVGESLISLGGPADRPIDRGTPLDMTFAGAEVNVAIGLSRLGHPARWVSVLGEDLFGQVVYRGLRGEGVDVSGVQFSSSGPTALMVKNRRSGGEPEVFYYRAGSAMSKATPLTFGEDVWTDARVLYLTGITPALSANCREMTVDLITRASFAGIEIWFDPNHRRKLWTDADARETILPLLPKISVFSVGLSEGEMLTGKSDPRDIAYSLFCNGATQVILKTGTDGTWFFESSGSVHVPAFPIERVIDSVGAGDGFAAGVLAARLEGLDWETSLVRGNAVGAMVCQTKGDWEGLPTPRDLVDFLENKREAIR